MALALLALTGCVAQPVAPTRLIETIPLVRLTWADVGTPTPFRISTAGPGGPALLTLIYDTLLWKDERGIIPWLAERWSMSEDGREARFTLVDGVRWQDGQPLTARDVAFTFDLYRRAPYRWVATEMVASAEASGPREVVVRLRQPSAAFLDDVAGIVPILPEHVWSRIGDPLAYDGPDASLGSGPYRLVEYRPAEGAYRLVANDAYFRGPPRVREFQQITVPAETRLQAVIQGRAELAWTDDAWVRELVRDQPKLRALATAPLSVVRLAVNTERSPLDRVEVRQAVSYAINRTLIAETITRGPAIPGSAGVIPPDTPWYNPDTPQYRYDPAMARRLLRGETISLELIADPASREPELLAPMLREVGIALEVKRVDSRTRTQLLREGQFQLGLLSHIGVGGDPDFLRRWYAGEEANDFAQGSVFRHERFEAVARASATTVDPQQRRALVFEMQRILAEQQPTVVLYYRRFYWLHPADGYQPMNTAGGLLNGAPLVHNKLSFLPR